MAAVDPERDAKRRLTAAIGIQVARLTTQAALKLPQNRVAQIVSWRVGHARLELADCLVRRRRNRVGTYRREMGGAEHGTQCQSHNSARSIDCCHLASPRRDKGGGPEGPPSVT